MNFAQVLVILLLLTATVTTIGLAFFTWQRRRAVWTRPFALLMLAVAEWNLAKALELNASAQIVKLFWLNVQYIGIALVPVLFFAFTLAYHSQRRWLTRQYLPLLILPLVTIFLAWTNLGGLFRQQVQINSNGSFPILLIMPGHWFWVHTLYSYFLLLMGTFLLTQIWLRAPHYRQRATIVLLGALIPWLGIALFIFRLTLVDLTPVALTISGILLGWGLLHLQLFQLAPIARRVVVDQMRDGVIVLDGQGLIADINKTAAKIFGHTTSEMLGRSLINLLPELKWLADYNGQEVLHHEITWDEEIYEIQTSSILTGDEVTGSMLILHCITERKQIEAELLNQKDLLQNLVLVAKATTTTQALKATLQNILDVAVAITQAEYGSLFVINAHGEITHSILTQDKSVPLREQQNINQRVLEKGLFGWIWLNGELALIEDTEKDERWLTLPDRTQKVGSALGIPISDHRGVIGVLTLTHSEKAHFGEQQGLLMQSAADHMALALRNAQLYDTQKQLAQRQRILYEVMRAMEERLDERWITRTAVDAISHFTGWSSIVILLVKEGKLTVEAVSGSFAQVESEVASLVSGINERAFVQGKTQVIVECEEDCQDLPDNNRSGVSIPLRHGERALGVLAFYSKKTAAFDKDDVQLGEALAEAIALSLENAHLHANIRNYATDLGALIAASRDGIIYIDLNKNVRVINDMAMTLLGLQSGAESWVNLSISHIFTVVYAQLPPPMPQADFDSEQELAALEREVDFIRTGEEPAYEGELNLPPYTIYWLSLPLIAEGEPLGRLLVLRDVTEERLLARMREDLIHMTVHDLRNPLTTQSLAIELLSHDIGEQSQPFLEVLENNNAKMLGLVNNLLDISRLENHQMPLKYEGMAVLDLVTAALAQQQALALEKAITLQSHVLEGLPPARIDRSLVERVLQNLIGNAVKFTPQQGTIRVTADLDPDSYGDWLIFFVYNTGEGIPLDLQERLFDKFTTGTQEGRGSGLGLAFCKMVVEAHGGRIWVESTPGQDATFAFTLPAV